MARAKDEKHRSPSPDDDVSDAIVGAEDREFQLALDQFKAENREYDDYSGTEEYVKHLEAVYTAYATANEFRSGDFVQWKPYMRNKRFPFYGRPAVVVEVLDSPLLYDSDGEALGEVADIRLGILRPDEDFTVFLFNSHRFMPWAS